MVVKTDPSKYLARIRADQIACEPKLDAFYQCDCTLVHKGQVAWKGYNPSAEECDPEG